MLKSLYFGGYQQIISLKRSSNVLLGVNSQKVKGSLDWTLLSFTFDAKMHTVDLECTEQPSSIRKDSKHFDCGMVINLLKDSELCQK